MQCRSFSEFEQLENDISRELQQRARGLPQMPGSNRKRFLLKSMNCVSNMMDLASEMMDCASKMMDFALITMI